MNTSSDKKKCIQDSSSSKCLELSAIMLESFWRRTVAEFPELSEEEQGIKMFQRLEAINNARNRIGKSWIQSRTQLNTRANH